MTGGIFSFFFSSPEINKNEEMLTNEKQTKTRFSYFILLFKRAVACVWGWKQQQQQRLHQNQPNVSAHLNTVYIPF
jgi:hypothetical protein